MDKKAVMRLHSGILLRNRKDLTFVAAWMGLESVMLSEIA